MPLPFINKEFDFAQPDGTKISLFGTGNQHFAVFEDKNGYVVVRNPAGGFYTYATLNDAQTEFIPTPAIAGQDDPTSLGLGKHLRAIPGSKPSGASFAPAAQGQKTRWEQRIEEKARKREQARQAAREGRVMAPPTMTSVGDFLGLCILIEFPDIPATILSPEVDDFCNKIGYDGFGNNGSVHDYFLDVSNGRLRYTNQVTAYYTAQNPRAHYTDETIPDGQRARELIVEALHHLKTTGHDFSQITTDNSGFARALNVFYAGARVNNWSKGLWPHSWHLASAFSVGGGKKFFDYQFTNMGNELELGTFCHENGHMVCDFPDLYDYAQDNIRSSGIGHYCLMCAGGRDEKNPVRVGAYLNRMAGWAQDVTTITPGMSGTLADNKDEFLIHSKTADEYFIVEHRHASGRDADLPSSGLAVWHVDHKGSNEHQGGSPSQHYECALMQADGRKDLENGRNRGDAGDLFSTATATAFGLSTTPDSQWWDTAPSGLEIKDIGAAGGDISYRIPSETGGQEVIMASGKSTPNLAIPDNNPGGVEDSITLQNKGIAGFIEVIVDIEHSFRGDLVVSLRAPSGAIAVLHNRNGGGQDNITATYDSDQSEPLGGLLEQSIAGDWTLVVSDHAFVDTGKLKSWSINILSLPEQTNQISEEISVAILDNTPAGISRPLTATGTQIISAVSVMVDITHSFIGDLVVSLTSPDGTKVNLHNQSGGGSDNIIQTYTQDSLPGLTGFNGATIAGDWTLHVSDHAGADKGKLNRWAVTFNQPVS